MSRSYDCNTLLLSANYGNLDSVMQSIKANKVNRSHFCKKLFDDVYINIYINVLIALSVCKRHVNK